MAGDEGTLATTAEVLLAIGQNGSAAQILEANTNIWVKWAEGEMSALANRDLVANVASISTNYKRWFAVVAANRAAWWGINQNQNSWQLATTQSKLNVLDESWQTFRDLVGDKNVDILDTVGL